jgi:hypothetical protein
MDFYLLSFLTFVTYVIWHMFFDESEYKMNEKIRNVITVGLFLMAFATFLSNGPTVYDNLNETFGGYFGVLLFIVFVIVIIFSTIISISFITKSLDYIIHKRAKQKITVKLSKESKLSLGGHLTFDVNFTNWFFNGYFVINMSSPYWEEKSIRIRYDNNTKQGQLKGKYDDEHIQLRCTIPKHWGFGEYDITIRTEDVCKWGFSLKKTMNLSSQKLSVMIDNQ